MYQFICANEVPLTFSLHSQFPLERCARESIQCYHGCVIHVILDEDSVSTETLELLCDEVLLKGVMHVH